MESYGLGKLGREAVWRVGKGEGRREESEVRRRKAEGGRAKDEWNNQEPGVRKLKAEV
jgi:hypothetical protein